MFLRLLAACLVLPLSVGTVRAEAGPLQLQPIKSVTAAKAKPAMSSDEIVAKANEYFNSAGTMVADFVQIGGDGRRTDGKLYVDRPGKMRFAYAPPATLEIIADGTSVAVIDRKLHTQDLYFIGQTPLKFLLSDHINLAEDATITDVTSDRDSASVVIEDHQTFGGTSRIRLTFGLEPFALRQWTITDPQGYETVVSLNDLDLASKPDPALFKISTERMLNTRN
jgi:outer membrane lipoprotein-sorting protein